MTVTAKCPKCHGTGRISGTNVAGGICFRCDGTRVIPAAEAAKAAAAAKRTAARQAAALKKVQGQLAAKEAAALATYGDAFRLAKALVQFNHPVAAQAAGVVCDMRDSKPAWVIEQGISEVLPRVMREFQVTGMSIDDIEAAAAK